MSKNISIKVGGVSRNFSNVPKIQTEEALTGDTINWIPEDEANDYAITETARITENGTYHPSSGKCGFNEVVVNVQGGGTATLIEKTVTQNGDYYATDDNADGYSKVTVNVGGTVVSMADYLNLTYAQKIATPYLIGDDKFGLSVDNRTPQIAWYDFVSGIGVGIDTPTLLAPNRYSLDFANTLSKSIEITIECRARMTQGWGGGGHILWLGFNTDNTDTCIYMYDNTIDYRYRGNTVHQAGVTDRGYYFQPCVPFEMAFGFCYDPYDNVLTVKTYIDGDLIDTWVCTDMSVGEFFQIFTNLVTTPYQFYLNSWDGGDWRNAEPLFFAATSLDLDANHFILPHDPVQIAMSNVISEELPSAPAFWMPKMNKDKYGFVASATYDPNGGHIALNGVDAQSGNVVVDGDVVYDHLLYPNNSDIVSIGTTGGFWLWYGAVIVVTSAAPFVDADFQKMNVTSGGSITTAKAYQKLIVAVTLTDTADFSNNAISINGAVVPNMTVNPVVSGHNCFVYYREYVNAPSGTTFALSMQNAVYGGSFMVVGVNV